MYNGIPWPEEEFIKVGNTNKIIRELEYYGLCYKITTFKARYEKIFLNKIALNVHCRQYIMKMLVLNS